MIRFTWRNFCSEYWSSPSPIRRRRRCRRAGRRGSRGPRRCGVELRFEPDVPAGVVVDVDQRGVDRVDPLLDHVGLLVQLRLEAGDVPDRVLVEVGLELLLEAGQVVVGEPLVQLAVAGRGLDGVVELGCLHRVLAAELAHRVDDAAARPGLPLSRAVVGQRRDLAGGGLGLVAGVGGCRGGSWPGLRRARRRSAGELRSAPPQPRARRGPPRCAAAALRRRRSCCSTAPSVCSAARSCARSALPIVSLHRLKLGVQPGQLGRRRLQLRAARPSAPRSRLTVDCQSISANSLRLVQAREHLAALDRGIQLAP